MFEQLAQLGKTVGPTAVVAVFALYILWQLLKEKRNNKNGNGNVIKAIKELRGNDLGEINTKLDRLDDKTDRVVSLLIEIKTLLRK